MSNTGDDRVGWDAVSPEFRETVRKKARQSVDLWSRLRETPFNTENIPARVRLWQQIHDLDTLPSNFVFYQIAWELASIASNRYMGLYESNFEPRLRAIYQRHGIDLSDFEAVESWTDIPEELEILNDEMEEAENRCREEVYREFGETEMTDLWRNNRTKFDERWRIGQEIAHPGLESRLQKMANGEIGPEELFKRET